MLSRFHLIPVTDGGTDGQICYINIAHQHTALLTRDKNEDTTIRLHLFYSRYVQHGYLAVKS